MSFQELIFSLTSKFESDSLTLVLMQTKFAYYDVFINHIA